MTFTPQTQRPFRRTLTALLAILTAGLLASCVMTESRQDALITVSKTPVPTDNFEAWLVQYPPSDPRWPYHYVDFQAAGVDAWNPGSLSAFPSTENREWKTLVIENDYLRVVLLPDLGGRIWRIEDKKNGTNRLFENPAGFKINPWGRLGWWIAAGGTELMAPLDEHAGPFYLPWRYTTATTGEGVEVRLVFDEREYFGLEKDRWVFRMEVFLPHNAAYVELRTKIENRSSEARDLSAWTNTMSAPGVAGMQHRPGSSLYGTAGLDQRISFGSRTTALYNHNDNGGRPFWSADGDGLNNWDLLSWPVKRGPTGENGAGGEAELDISLLKNWYAFDLGFAGLFARADGRKGATGDRAWTSIGQYNLSDDLGIVKVYPSEIVSGIASGAKYWQWGSHTAGGWQLANLFSDGQGTYAELMAGPATLFAEPPTNAAAYAAREALRDGDGQRLPSSVRLAAGESVSWIERYIAPEGIEDLSDAFPGGAVALGPAGADRAPESELLHAAAGGSLTVGVGVYPVTAGTVSLTFSLVSGTASPRELASETRKAGPGSGNGPLRSDFSLLIPADSRKGAAELLMEVVFPDGSSGSSVLPLLIE